MIRATGGMSIDREEVIKWIDRLIENGVARGWFAVVCAEVQIVWKCKLLGKTYYFRTWSRPKSDPTLQVQISMQTQVQIRMQTQFEMIFACVLQKYAPRSSGEHLLRKRTLSNRPSKIHLLEH